MASKAASKAASKVASKETRTRTRTRTKKRTSALGTEAENVEDGCYLSESRRDEAAAHVDLAGGVPLPQRLKIGSAWRHRNKSLAALRDSTPLFIEGKFNALKARLDFEGYLLVRGVIAEQTALAARRRIVEHIAKRDALMPGSDPMEARINALPKAKKCRKAAGSKGGGGTEFVAGYTVDAESGGTTAGRDDDHVAWAKVGNSSELTSVYNGPDLHKFFAHLWNTKFIPQTGCTWLRMKGHGQVTAEHADYYYFRRDTDLFSGAREDKPRNRWVCVACKSSDDQDEMVLCDLCDDGYHRACATPALPSVSEGSDENGDLGNEWHCHHCANTPLDVYTCWVSMSHVEYHNSVLAVVPGTQKLYGYEKPTHFGLTPYDYDKIEGHAVWRVAPMFPGDIILFNIKTIHGACKNTSDVFRVSLDTRVVRQKWNVNGVKARMLELQHKYELQSRAASEAEAEAKASNETDENVCKAQGKGKRRTLLLAQANGLMHYYRVAFEYGQMNLRGLRNLQRIVPKGSQISADIAQTLEAVKFARQRNI